MIKSEKVIVMDIDGTIANLKQEGQSYSELYPLNGICDRLRNLKSGGYWIILYTSRNMRTHNGNIGRILKDTAPTLLQWLEKHDIPYDEIHFGKPWCGHGGFYVDDNAIRPREFLELTLDEISELLEKDRVLT